MRKDIKELQMCGKLYMCMTNIKELFFRADSCIYLAAFAASCYVDLSMLGCLLLTANREQTNKRGAKGSYQRRIVTKYFYRRWILD